MYRIVKRTRIGIIMKDKTLSQIEEATGMTVLAFVAFVVVFVDFIWDLAATLSLRVTVVAECL